MRSFARSFFATALLGLLGLGAARAQTQPLTTVEYRIGGTGLQVSPSFVAAPKGIPASVLVSIFAGGSTNGPASEQLASGAYVEAILRGPAFPEARRLVGQPNAPLLLPSISLVGDYQLDAIRLVDSATGATRLDGTPSSVRVQIFDEALISRVTSRPLTIEEIQEKGIVIDESNFRAVEFEVAFVLDGKTIPVTFPVVAPKFTESTELIPAAELEARLQEAAAINQRIATEIVSLPPEFEVANLNIQVQGLNFQPVDDDGAGDLGIRIPPIPALMVIPGNIGYLNQFFSVRIFTENGSPQGSSLNVRNVQAHLLLPPGPDRVASTNYAQPGDDPLRFARIGPDKIIQPYQNIVRAGPDGQFGTADDILYLKPGESGEAEFLVEGLQEGLHVMDLDLTADLEGLAAGTVKVQGKAAGSVLVRNPRFSMAFSHPRTVRAGEPYEASVTLLNTGPVTANLLSVTLNKNSISGAVLEPGQSETIELGTLQPGQSATAVYRLRSQRTGSIAFSNLTTSDDSVVGRFRLSMGVDERGVALSPDSIGMPDFVNGLPPEILTAANRVLGQALSVATAGQLPTGVVRVARSTVTRRVLELAEAGQRLRYGDQLSRVLPDLLRDWQGGRLASDGFDQIMRNTDAGAEWRAAYFAVMERDGLTGSERLVQRASDLAGLGQSFAIGAAGPGQLRMDFGDGSMGANTLRSANPYSLVYGGTNGNWAVTASLTNAVFTWTFTNTVPQADLAVLVVAESGQAKQLRWTISNPPTNAIYTYALSNGGAQLAIDANGDGVADGSLSGVETAVRETPPALIAVEQDLSVVAGRPGNPCDLQGIGNYGTVVAVVFSKPITQQSAGNPDSYTLDGSNGANSVQVQPNGRVALLNLRKGISAIRPRTLTVSNVTDLHGIVLATASKPVRSVAPGTNIPFTSGAAIRGRVLRGDGSVAAGVPVTLTMYDNVYGPNSCESWVRRVSQVFTDAQGSFDFDFVLAGIAYSISATDTSGLSPEAIRIALDSTAQESVDRQRIEDLANSAAYKNTLLGLFAAGSLPEAIAKVEGLDRALVRDVIPVGSGRAGQEVPIALRFRGRATVAGQIVAADGVTPLPQAAVNLFPDADSRELGRGLFADSQGRFAFFGVPLGVFSIDVKTSDRRGRTISGLLNTPGQTTNLVIALPSLVTGFGTLRGRVFESDNLTPHGKARVFIGQYDGNKVRDVVRIVDADADGFWEAAGLPIRALDVIAVTVDGARKGLRLAVTPSASSVTYANITLEAVTRVVGRVQFDDGRPAPNALVAGGAVLARTDALGNFQLEGVPIGSRSFSAGLERNPAAGIDFPRLGSASAQILSGTDNFVVIKLRAAGRIFGKVLNAQGQPMRGIRVAIPQDGGFFWTDADSQGNYVFENLPVQQYTLSAPANAVAPSFNESALLADIRSGDEDKILAAFEEAITVFVGAEDPLITGAHDNFRPSSWGFTKARLRFDGDSVNADIRFIPQGTVSGRVLNHQGVPIGAKVRLTGMGPSKTGEPSNTLRGERDTDPATGVFIFPNQLLAGQWQLQAASPFYPTVITESGFTTEINPDVTNIVLQFPPVREVNGRIAGRVLNPDGSTVGAGARVKISFSDDYEIQTDTNGFFDTQIALPALGRSYTLQAFDPASGLRGIAGINMTPGITNVVDIRLLTRNSAVQVNVLRANGLPAVGAVVELDHGSYPFEQTISAVADSNGRVVFNGLWEGNYAARAQFTEGSTRLFARGGATVPANEARTINLRMGITGTVEGTFVKRDLTTPIEAAQVAIGNLGFATTDASGKFRFVGVPVGMHRLVTSDPVTGAAASGSVTISIADEIQAVQLVEALRGEVTGVVIDSYGAGFVAGAEVRIAFSDGLTQGRTVTTGPDGRFAFPGSPMGTFRVTANYRLLGGQDVSGSIAGTLAESAPTVDVRVQLQPLAVLPIRIVKSDGVTPEPNARVSVRNQTKDTDTDGRVVFENLGLGSAQVLALSRTAGELRSGAQTNVTIVASGTNALVTVRLLGVGTINGVVLASDGITPVENAEVVALFQGGPFSGENATTLSDSQGRFAFEGVPVASYRLTAASQSLGVTLNGSIDAAGEVDVVTLRLRDSGTIVGRILRADGVTPGAGLDVSIEYQSQSANPGRAFFRTGPNGVFRFDNIPLGPFHLTSFAPLFGGIIDLSQSLTINGQILDLGNLIFDEELPRIVSVNPPNTSIDVPILISPELVFSEAIQTNSLRTNGIFLRDSAGIIPSTLELLPDTNGVPRIIRLDPIAPLVSQRSYELIVVSGDLLAPNGSVIGSGPRDRVGRGIPATVSFTFTTADNDPPILLSLFPSNNAVQIDPRAVPRLSFNEPIRSTGFVFQVVGPNGLVPGIASVGANGQALSFVPTTELPPNATYSLIVSNVFDIAGNRATNEPFASTFATLDTVGPAIASLQLSEGSSPVAGARVPVQATLVANEPGASVRFSQDFVSAGSASNAPYRVFLTLPAQGSTTVRAIAADQYGNDGPVAELTITVASNRPPVITFARVTPLSGPARTGEPFALDVLAADDSAVVELKASATALGLANLIATNNNRLRIEGVLPASAGPGNLQIVAEARDDSGQSSGLQTFTLPIADATLPTIAILSPANGSLVSTGSTVQVTVNAADNFGVTYLQLAATGSFTTTIRAPLNPAQTNGTNVLSVPIPADVPENGSTLHLVVTAEDAAGNLSLPAALTLRLPDRTPPTLLGMIPSADSTNVDVSQTFELTFSEVLDTNTIANTAFLLVEKGSTNATALNVTLLPDAARVRVDPVSALAINTDYILIVSNSIADVAGNRLAANITNEFRTADFRLTRPIDGQRFVEGQGIALEAASTALQFSKVRFVANGSEVAVVTSAPFARDYVIPSLDALGTNRLAIKASALDNTDSIVAEASVVVAVLPGSEDSDGDGVSNADELARGTDPFTPNAAPVILAPVEFALVQNVRTNFLVSANDRDTNLIRLELRESATDNDVKWFSLFRFAETGAPNYVSAATLSLTGRVELQLAFTNAVQIFIRAVDADGLSSLQPINITILQDLDGDGIPDRDDPDIDGDGLSNEAELAAGTNPLLPDTDGDGIPDGEEAVPGADGFVTNPLLADTDNDGLDDATELALGLDPTVATSGTETVVIDNRTVTLTAPARFKTLILTNGAVLTHPATALGAAHPLVLTVENLVIDASSRIDVDNRGYLGGLSGANGSTVGLRPGNVYAGGSVRRTGGSYGGVAGIGTAEQIQTAAYGSFRDPTELGSGGGSDFGAAGNGGGLVRISAQAISLDGQIVARGGNGSRYAGGGSGGGVKITAGSLQGNGSISANGGGAGVESGGGSGGRVAVYVTNATSFALANITAFGGNSSRQNGAPGTIYWQVANGIGDLVLDAGLASNIDIPSSLVSLAGGVATAVDPNTLTDRKALFVEGALVGLPLRSAGPAARAFTIVSNTATMIYTDPRDGNLRDVFATGAAYKGELNFGRLLINRGATVEIFDGDRARADRRGYLQAGEIQVTAQSRLTHPYATPVSQFGLDLDVSGSVTVGVDCQIEADGRGYLGGLNGIPEFAGRTLGNISAGGSVRRVGGSHGGLGGRGTAELNTASVYGDFRNPNIPGSGGGADGGAGGNGGGVIRLRANSLVLDGAISVNGSAGSRYAGGGAGGAVNVQVAQILGDGAISADGGGAGVEAGGGGGGRIALTYLNVGSPEFANVSAIGGAAREDGAPGTIFHQPAGASGHLIIRGSGRETPLPNGNLAVALTIDQARVAATDFNVTQLALTNAAVLTHDAIAPAFAPRLEIVANAIDISTNSQIDVSGRGYPGGQQVSGAGIRGWTLGNQNNGSNRRVGGSYGGLGGTGTAEQDANPIYGAYRDPNEAGSGGGADGGPGGSGGGLVRIVADALNLQGAIRANGSDGSRYAGGGSGGGIKLNLRSFAGDGVIEANGGAAGVESGGGGGGRIALFYTQSDGAALSHLTTFGGTGRAQGGPGTVYSRQTSALGELLIAGVGRETPLVAGAADDNVTIQSATVSGADFRAVRLELKDGAVVTHDPATLETNSAFRATVSTLIVSTNSRIDVSGRGLLGGGNGLNGATTRGRTIGNSIDTGSMRRNGGSYGGLGGGGTAEQFANAIYGDYRNPGDPGSGGGSDSGPGGNGGGIVQLNVSNLILNGEIRSNGDAGSRYAGGGSGGSVQITASSVLGLGRIQANGGDAGVESGGGGGGRIAINYTGSLTLSGEGLQANGGAAREHGGSGTIYTRRGADLPQIVIRNAGRETPLPAQTFGGNWIIDGSRVVATQWFASNVLLTNGAVLTHPAATVSEEFRLAVNAINFSIDASSRIDVSSRGYLGGSSAGNPSQSARTYGNVAEGGSLRRNAGSYGGLGGYGTVERNQNPIYGGFRLASDLGSGGGSDSGPGGSGGGSVTLNVQSLDLAGSILAQGGDGSRFAGGGSGGGIRINAQSIAGPGAIAADGGRGGQESGGGGGGRIAIYYENLDRASFTNVHALGGDSDFQKGTPGTIYWQSPASTAGELVIDAWSTNVTASATPLVSLAPLAVSSVLGNVAFSTNANLMPGSLVGLSLQADDDASRSFMVVSNSATAIIFNATELPPDFSPGYLTGVPNVGNLAIRNSAVVELVDADRARENRLGRFQATRAQIVSASRLTHPAITPANRYGLELSVAETLLVDASSEMNTAARGYLGGSSQLNPSQTGYTDGNLTLTGSSRRNGGGYGGFGGLGDIGGSLNSLYGTESAPVQPGSGGGSDSGPAGNGGGVIKVYAALFQLDGALNANGGSGSRFAAGGSGGSIYVRAARLQGQGAMRANGGDGGAQSGGGGGGRIALYFTEMADFLNQNITATGGSGYSPGGGGTIFDQRTNIVTGFEAPLAPPARLLSIRVIAPKSGDLAAEGPSSARIVLRWRSSSGQFQIQSSADLKRWTTLNAQTTLLENGDYEAQIPVSEGKQYYRILSEPN